MNTVEWLALMLSQMPEEKQEKMLLVMFGMNLDNYMSTPEST